MRGNEAVDDAIPTLHQWRLSLWLTPRMQALVDRIAAMIRALAGSVGVRLDMWIGVLRQARRWRP